MNLGFSWDWVGAEKMSSGSSGFSSSTEWTRRKNMVSLIGERITRLGLNCECEKWKGQMCKNLNLYI